MPILCAASVLASGQKRAEALNRKDPFLERIAEPGPSCMFHGSSFDYIVPGKGSRRLDRLLERGERAMQTECGEEVAHIRTDRSLISVPLRSMASEGRMGISLSHVKSDLASIYEQGFVSMSCHGDACYILSRKDRKVRELRSGTESEMIRTFGIRGSVQGAGMAVLGSTLIVACPTGLITGIDRDAWSGASWHVGPIEGRFFTSGGQLHFGSDKGRKITFSPDRDAPAGLRISEKI